MSFSISQDNYSLKVFGSTYKIEEMRSALLKWFEFNGRHSIPWKLKPDGSLPKKLEQLPVYPIWIAEVMLQQTQLKVVMPYWENWMRTFPTLIRLSNALEHDVLLLWQGLGYYSRARRIYKASNQLLRVLGDADSLDPSSWPTDLETWVGLPGIGPTTAASILSSAFDLPEALLDGNVKRVLARLIASKKKVSTDSNRLWAISNELLDHDSPRNFNQALMDLGAMVCTPKTPKCFCCPLKKYCLAYHKGDVSKFPVKGSKKVLDSSIIGLGLIINNAGEVLIDQRKDDQTMGGMWEFPGGKQERGEAIESTIVRELYEELDIEVKVLKKLIEFDHSYTHKKLHFVAFTCKLISGQPKPLASLKIKWVQPENLVHYPFPAANQRIINALKEYLVLDIRK